MHTTRCARQKLSRDPVVKSLFETFAVRVSRVRCGTK